MNAEKDVLIKEQDVLIKEKDQENERLQRTVRGQTYVLEGISSGHLLENIEEQLTHGQPREDVLSRLRLASTQPVTYDADPLKMQPLQEIVEIVERDCRTRLQRQNIDERKAPECSWTSITTDSLLINHLIDLYFTYVHPVHMLFWEDRFRSSFEDHGPECSRSLLSAVCAMACHFYGQARYESEARQQSLGMGVLTPLRRAFEDEAKAALSNSPQNELLKAQAMGLLYLLGLSAGQTTKAVGYLKAAVDCLTESDIRTSKTVTSELTVIGIQSLSM